MEDNGLYYVNDTEGFWSKPKIISKNILDLPQFVVDNADNLIIVGMGGLKGYYTIKKDNIWTEKAMPIYICNPNIALSNDGTLYIVYNSPRDDLRCIQLINNDTWTIPDTIAESVDFPAVPQIGCDDNNNVFLIWNKNSTNQLVYSIKDSNGTWSNSNVIPNIEGIPWEPKMLIKNNKLHLIWNSKDPNVYNIHYQEYSINNKQWSNYEQISNTDNNSTILSFDIYNNTLFLVWQEKLVSGNEDYDLYFDVILID